MEGPSCRKADGTPISAPAQRCDAPTSEIVVFGEVLFLVVGGVVEEIVIIFLRLLLVPIEDGGGHRLHGGSAAALGLATGTECGAFALVGSSLRADRIRLLEVVELRLALEADELVPEVLRRHFVLL